jgi:catechol 2,3-dioxygenase-like lactoylglutathione lyase family enzyme
LYSANFKSKPKSKLEKTMNSALLEHVNFTVSDPDTTAKLLCDLFGWRVRWAGESMLGGRTVHVGADDSYLALYSPGETPGRNGSSYVTRGGLNHVGVMVDDLDAAEQRVLAAGFKTHNHGDYDPGRRFYFNDHDDIEYEVVNYS